MTTYIITVTEDDTKEVVHTLEVEGDRKASKVFAGMLSRINLGRFTLSIDPELPEE